MKTWVWSQFFFSIYFLISVSLYIYKEMSQIVWHYNNKEKKVNEDDGIELQSKEKKKKKRKNNRLLSIFEEFPITNEVWGTLFEWCDYSFVSHCLLYHSMKFRIELVENWMNKRVSLKMFFFFFWFGKKKKRRKI